MNLGHALAGRDEVTKQALYKLFSTDPTAMQRIDAGFAESAETWRTHLTRSLGRRAANFIFRALREEVPLREEVRPPQ
jgi:hypothetical protein